MSAVDVAQSAFISLRNDEVMWQKDDILHGLEDCLKNLSEE